MLFVTGLALADKQLSFVNVNPALMSDSHSVLIQGLTVGFDLYW